MDLKDIREFGNIEFLAKQMVEGFITGLHKSPFHGFSVEFAEHRLYNTGESTRHIDWKVFARTDRLYTKRYEEETNLRCQLLIDVSSSMYYPKENLGKITFSTMAAACLAFLLQKQKDAVSLCTFYNQIETHTPVKSTPSHIHKLFLLLDDLLKRPKNSQQTAITDVMHNIANKIGRRSLVIIFSDMFENIQDSEKMFSALQHLKHNRHEVLLFHVIDKKTEQEFLFDERPYEFNDIESGEKVRVRPSQIRNEYVKQVKQIKDQLIVKCGQYKIDYIEADIAEGFNQILHAYLVKRGKMK